MKKNYLLGMFAATGMLLATSCSNDELAAAQSGNEAQVTFSLGLENGIGSRALISDGTKADKLVYAVYKLDDQNKPVLQHVIGSNSEGQFVKDNFKSGDNVSVTLAKGQTYQVAFWAQDGDCTAYNTDKLTDVKVNYKNADETLAANNAEVRDAFFKTVEFTVAGNKTIDVVLKRPFAQINVGVYASDWEAAVASGITIENSKVVINNAATTINLLTGAVDGSTEVTYDLSAIPTETLEVETDENNPGKEEYKWLSMSYILVADNSTTDEDNDGTLGDARTTLESLKYTFAPESGNTITFAEGLNSVPVQRNWRTNILGKILTGDIQFNITIDPVYDSDIIYPEVNDNETAQQLEFVATFGGTAEMNNDVNLNGKSLNVGADAIFNLNGHTLTSGTQNDYGVIVKNGASATFNEANINPLGGGIGASNGANVIYNSGSLAVNSATTNPRYNFYATGEGSTITINGGNFTIGKLTLKRAYIYAGSGTTVYVKGGNFGKASTSSNYKAGIAGDGNVIITGGTFAFDPSNWVAEGYKVENKNGKFVVFAATNVSVTTTDDLSDLSGSVAASENIDYSNKQISIENNVVFDMNNNEVKAGSAADYGFAVRGVYAEFDNANVMSFGGGIAATNGAQVVFNNGSLAVNSTSTSGRYIFYATGTGSTITINEGTFSFDSNLTLKRAYIYAQAGTTVYVKGGNFGKASTRDNYKAGIMGEGNVIITGGTFKFNPTKWVASGYEATENNGTWTVAKK